MNCRLQNAFQAYMADMTVMVNAAPELQTHGALSQQTLIALGQLRYLPIRQAGQQPVQAFEASALALAGVKAGAFGCPMQQGILYCHSVGLLL